ncbi:aspartate-semialdehyde dehydrogenase [Caballeronia sp. M23-90]
MLKPTPLPFDVKSIADLLLDQCRAEDFSGYDPFDGLNSTAFDRVGGNRFSLARIAWLQFHKRSPFNLRKLVGVPKMRNPKGIALIILGLLERCRYERSEFELNEAVALGDWLLTQRADPIVWKHHAWGYHFDWAARAFYVPCGKPNAITTCYVARALYALGEITDARRFTDAAIDAGFFLDGLHLCESGVDYYGYIPGETAFVHNASLWAAAFVAETATRIGDESMLRRALRVAHQSVSMQRDDGSWPYGVRSHHTFVDGFHTGYNLEALELLGRTAKTKGFSDAIDKGLHYYRENFFLPDGTVKYYNDCVWPLDTHSVAQAVITLVRIGGTEKDFAIAERVLTRAHASLYLPDQERFIYQKGRWVTNSVNYLRWTQAWAFYALSVYAVSLETRPNEIE